MKSCMDDKKVLVCGYAITDQIKIDQHKETNHDGEIIISFSQETTDTLDKDTLFLKNYNKNLSYNPMLLMYLPKNRLTSI